MNHQMIAYQAMVLARLFAAIVVTAAWFIGYRRRPSVLAFLVLGILGVINTFTLATSALSAFEISRRTSYLFAVAPMRIFWHLSTFVYIISYAIAIIWLICSVLALPDSREELDME